MEEKKNQKFQVSVVLFVISVVVILALICCMILLQIHSNRKISDFQADAAQMQSTIESLQAQNSNWSEKELTYKARLAYEKYLEISVYENSSTGTSPGLLVELGLTDEATVNVLLENSDDPSTYIQSDVPYETFRSAMRNYMTDACFVENFSNYIDMDGYVGFNAGVGSNIIYKAGDISYLGMEGDYYAFQIDLIDTETYNFSGEIDERDVQTHVVDFAMENGKLVYAGMPSSNE